MKKFINRLSPIAAIILLSVMLLSACEQSAPRVDEVFTYSPGSPFSTNFKYEEPRRQIKCSVVFEVIDEQAIEELTELNFRVRNAVIAVLGELTLTEVTTEKDLEAIAERIVRQVNEDIQAGEHGERVDLILKAYFTEFVII